MPSERIQLLIDVVTGKSKSALTTLKTDLKAADGAFAKTKVASGALWDGLKKNAGFAALGAGTAIVGFATKAVGEFQKVALQAGELRDSLGLTSEEASRLAEVATDIGIPVEAVSSSLNRMNRAAADTPEAFDNIGAAIARNSDGTVDVNQTFLNTIDALNKIPDATERAAAAQEIFGRGWQSISELVGMGAEGMKEALASVEDSKIISDDEVAKAREMREQMDELRGKIEEVTLTTGQALLPVFTEVADMASEILGPFSELIKLYDKLPKAEEGDKGFGDDLKTFFTGSIPKQFDQFTDKWEHLGDLMGGGTEGTAMLDGIAPAVGDANMALSGFEARVSGVVAAEEAAADASGDMEANIRGAQAATELQGQAAETAAEQTRDHADALLEAADKAQAAADAMRASSDAGFALRDAQRDAADAAQNVQDVIDDEESSMQDLAEALDESSEAAISAADAQVELGRQRAAERGETLSSTQANDIFNNSLIDQAGTLKGPARDALVGHIAELNNIPPKKASEIQALIDAGKLNQAKRKLAEASAPRTATVTADANTAAAQAELDALDNPRTSTLTVHVFEKSHRQHGGKVPAEGELAVVGEAGPELVALPGGSRVYTNSQSKRMLGVQSFQHGGTVRRRGQAPRAARLEQQAERHAEYAERLRDEAKALNERAKAMEDGEEKDKVLEQADKKLDQANDQLDKSTTKAAKAAELHATEANKEAKALHADADAAHRTADALRNKADAGRAAAEVAAEGLREQSTSLREAADAQLAFEDAQRSAAEAAGHAARAFQVEGVTAAQQAEALNDAKQAAIALADAEVERARQRAEARGEEFTEQDQARVMEASLRRQARRGGDVGKAINDLIKTLDFRSMMRGFDRADARERNADRRADDEERRAKVYDKAGNQLDNAADKMERLADNLPDVFESLAKALAAGRITDNEFDRRVRHALNRIANTARAGRRG